MKNRLLLAALLLAGCSSNADRTDGSGDKSEPAPSPLEPAGAAGAVDEAPPSGGQRAAVARLERETGARWTIAVRKGLGTPAHLAGRTAPILKPGRDVMEATLGFFEEHRALFGMTSPRAELARMRVERDELDMTHVRMQQTVRGVPVRGAELVAHYRSDGSLATIDARYVAGLETLDTVPSISGERASELAIADAKAKNALRGEPEVTAASSLAIHAPDDAPAALAYELTVRAQGPERPSLFRYTIDAKTGAVLNVYDDIQEIAGSGVGVAGDTKQLQVSQSGTSYTLVDTTRTPSGIRTYNAGQVETLPGTLYSSTNANSWDTTGSGRGAAVDAHFYAGVVYDFYKTKLNRNGIDGNNGAIISTVHFGQAYNNAFWDPQRGQMAYGDGDGTNFRAFSASLDVIAHELTHGVTSNSSNLTYQNQSGALNEGMSDVFGALIEHFYKDGPNNFKMGEGIALGSVGLRDYIHPSTGQQPSNMSQYVQTTQDNGGVHTNSGIVNNAWYLMTIGGTNDASKVNVKYGIGWDKSAQVWFRANTRYLTSSSNFSDCARATLSSATDVGLTENEKNIIECAWIATGVLQGTCKTLVDPAPPPPPPPSNGGSTNNNGGTSPQGGADTTGEGDGATDGTGDEPAPARSPSRGYRPNNIQTTGCSATGTSSAPDLSLGVLAGVAILAARRRKRA